MHAQQPSQSLMINRLLCNKLNHSKQIGSNSMGIQFKTFTNDGQFDPCHCSVSETVKYAEYNPADTPVHTVYRKTLYLQYIDCVHTRVCACISGIAKTGSNVTHFPLITSLIAKHPIMLKQLITFFKFTNDTSRVQNSPSGGKWCNSRHDGAVPRVQM